MFVRILTENKNYHDTMALIKQYFGSAAVISTNSLWQGIFEHGLIIEIDLPIIDTAGISGKDEQSIKQLCYEIKRLNKQDKILVQYINCNSMLI